MPKVTYVESSGAEHALNLSSGTTARDAAINHGIPGIDGDCGGLCACATCHVYVDPAWIDTVGRSVAGELEGELLQFAEDVRENSRLACQITITEELDGLILRIPASQH